MRVLLLILLITSFLFAKNYEITCVGDANTQKLNDLAYHLVSGEVDTYDPENPYINFDTHQTTSYFYDSDSAVCGGENDNVIEYRASCDDGDADDCWFHKLGKAGEVITDYDPDKNVYFNNVILVNSYPCLPKNTTRFTIGLTNTEPPFNAYEPPFMNAVFDTVEVDGGETLRPKIAEQYRNICKKAGPNTDNARDYSGQLNTIIDNTSENKNLVAINQRDEKLDNDLTTYVEGLSPEIDDEVSITDFQSTYELTLDDSFEAYSDVFGFGEYGSAPAPISFDFLGKSYEVFNINIIESHVDMIRNTFAIFAYLWGIIIVFRGV